jgi:hypothetical protein
MKNFSGMTKYFTHPVRRASHLFPASPLIPPGLREVQLDPTLPGHSNLIVAASHSFRLARKSTTGVPPPQLLVACNGRSFILTVFSLPFASARVLAFLGLALVASVSDPRTWSASKAVRHQGWRFWDERLRVPRQSGLRCRVRSFKVKTLVLRQISLSPTISRAFRHGPKPVSFAAPQI